MASLLSTIYFSYRGWYQTQTLSGKHWILDSRTYDKSPGGELYNKLQENFNVQGNHSNYMIRTTTYQQALEDSMRPKTAPGLYSSHIKFQ